MNFWYEDGQGLNWLVNLWNSRDPLVRASALQLLTGLTNGPHTASQLFKAVELAPNDLCDALLYFMTSQEQPCIVKEEACLALSQLIKNSNSTIFKYV